MATSSRVLVAGDNPVVTGTVSWLLRENGWKATTVTNSDELFDWLSHAPPDLIFLDTENGSEAVLSMGSSPVEGWRDGIAYHAS